MGLPYIPYLCFSRSPKFHILRYKVGSFNNLAGGGALFMVFVFVGVLVGWLVG